MSNQKPATEPPAQIEAAAAPEEALRMMNHYGCLACEFCSPTFPEMETHYRANHPEFVHGTPECAQREAAEAKIREEAARKAFEECFGYVGWQRNGIGYQNPVANFRWEGWQAALAHRGGKK